VIHLMNSKGYGGAEGAAQRELIGDFSRGGVRRKQFRFCPESSRDLRHSDWLLALGISRLWSPRDILSTGWANTGRCRNTVRSGVQFGNIGLHTSNTYS